MKDITVSEMFYSVQCEGRSTGIPAVFLRLTGCKLLCQWCDTLEVWKHGIKYTVVELAELFNKNGFTDKLKAGAHLVITGGDPLLQQEALVEFLDALDAYVRVSSLFIEVETEGVIQPIAIFAVSVDQWNVSPKTSNSGMPLERRFKPDVLLWHTEQSNFFFKFVVATRADVLEAFDLVSNLELSSGKPISRSDIYLMPASQTDAEFAVIGREIVEYSKEFCVRFSPRLHLTLWNQKCGV